MKSKWAVLLGLSAGMLMAGTVQAQFRYTTNSDKTNTITITGWTVTSTNGSVNIPSTIGNLVVSRIENRAFQDCTNLNSVTMDNSLTTIGAWAFFGCTNLLSITIPASVTNIGDHVFCRCSSLTAITVDALNPSYSSSDGILFDKSKTILIQCAERKAGSVTIPASVTNIANEAFYGCADLTTVTIPNSVTSIGDAAFDSCTSLTSIMIPASVTNIGNDAFLGCSSLTAITVDALNPSYSSSDGILFDKSKTILIQCAGRKAGNVTIPASVTNIGDFAFDGCSSLANVTIPNGVTHIQHYAFHKCSSLTNVTIPNSVADIGCSAFARCSSLTSVKIPDKITRIDDEMFQSCTALTNVTIPDSVECIAYGVFIGCSNLTSVTIPASVNNIGGACGGAFRDCNSLTSVYFKGNAPVCGMMPIFFNATNATIYYLSGTTGWSTNFAGRPTKVWMTNAEAGMEQYFGYMTNADNTITITGYTGTNGSVNIPSTINGLRITCIGDNAFSEPAFNSPTACRHIVTSITIPDSVTNIGSKLFNNCTKLTSIYFKGNAPRIPVVPAFVPFPVDFSPFFHAPNLTIYYRPGTTGWSTNFAGRPTKEWKQP